MRRLGSGWWLVIVTASLLSACDLKQTFTGSADIVARAGRHTLSVDKLAEHMAGWQNLPLRRDMAERWAHRWVEYTLLAERVAAGDSLLDSATVRWARWPTIHDYLVEEYHDSLVAERVQVDARDVDSVYAAGELRIIYHILIKAPPDLKDPERARARRRAEAVWRQLMAGGSWEVANERSEDVAARQRGGSLGIIWRGKTVRPFDSVAYSLEPGEISGPTETSYGFHVVRRPVLSVVYDTLEAAVNDMLMQRQDSLFLDELAERWELKVRRNAPELLRETAREPLRSMRSNAVIGTYKGGKLTAAGVVRWLQVLPATLHAQMPFAHDDQLIEIATSLLQREALAREARQFGAKVTDGQFAELKFELRQRIIRVRGALELDVAFPGPVPANEHLRAVDSVIDDYYRGLAVRERDIVLVPAFLAEKLRYEYGWDVSSIGLDRAVEQATVLRGGLDTVTLREEQ